MPCYALMCIVAAFMIICGRNKAHAISFQPVPPFSGNFLQEVADFDSIVEPESNQESAPNVIKIRNSMSDEDKRSSDKSEEIPYQNHPYYAENNDEKSFADVDKIKRELGQMGTVFVNKFFDSDSDPEREERSFKVIEERPFSDEPKEDENENEDSPEEALRKDKDFQEEQLKAKNLTNTSRLLFDEIENGKANGNGEEDEACCENEAEKGQVKELVAPAHQKGKPGNPDLLEMHFYKYLPETGKVKIAPEDKKSVLINLYPEDKTNKKGFQIPEKYDYIALLSKDNKFVQVPAVKFTVVPGESANRRRRSDQFEPFYISRYRKYPQSLKFQPPDNLYHTAFKGVCPSHWSHVPILFINTIPGLQRRFGNKVYKRSSDMDLADNKYLREANLLIQNVNTSLRMGLTDNKKPMSVDAGVLVNPKYESSTNQRSKLYDKKSFKKEVNDEFDNSRNNLESELSTNDLSLSSAKENNLVNNNEMDINKGENLVRNEITSIDSSSHKENSEDNAALSKNEINLVTTLPNRDDSLIKNIINPLEIDKANMLQKTDVNPAEIIQNKDDSLTKSELSSLDVLTNNVNSLIDSEIGSLNFKDNGLAKSEINSLDISPSKDNNLIKDELNSLDFTSNKDSSLIKNDIGTIDFPSSKDNTLIKSEVGSLDVSSNNDPSPIKSEINPLNNLIKSEVSPMDMSSNNDPSAIKNEINPLNKGLSRNEIQPLDKSLVKSDISLVDKDLVKNDISLVDKGLLKNDVSFAGKGLVRNDVSLVDNGLIKNEVSSLEGSSKVNSFIKNEISPSEVSENKDSNLIKSEVSTLELTPHKSDSFVKNEISPMEVAPGKIDTFVNNGFNPMEITPQKSNGLVNNINNPMNVGRSSKNRFVKSEVSPVENTFKAKNLIKNDISSLEIGSNKDSGEDVVGNNEIDKAMELVTNNDGLSDPFVKNEINPVYVPNDNPYLDNMLDNKVNDLSENVMNSDNHNAEQSENVVQNKNEQNSNNMINKQDMMSSAYLIDLLKNVDMLKKSDPNFKFISQNKEKNMNRLIDEPEKEGGSSTCEFPDFAMTTTSTTALEIGLTPAQVDQESKVPDESNVNNPAPASVIPNIPLSTHHVNELPENGLSTPLPKAPVPSHAPSDMNNTNGVVINESTSKGNVSAQNQLAANETMYEDENDVGNILDLLGSNTTICTTVGTTEGKGGKGTSSTTSATTGHISMSVTSVPTISAGVINSTPTVGTVVYEKTTCGKSTTQAAPSTTLSLVAKGKSALLNQLHNLQKDLKLVFEVQNILSGSKKQQEKKNKRRKREIFQKYRLRRKCKNSKNKSQLQTASKLNPIQEVQALGKILQWKAKNEGETTTNCKRTKRFLFKKRRKKKRKKKKKKKKRKKKKKWWKRVFGHPADQRHFLGTLSQNFL